MLNRKPRLTLKPKAPGERFPERRHKLYREFIRVHDCVFKTHARTPVGRCYALPGRFKIECAHYVTRGAGGDDVGNCFPACAYHHDEQEAATGWFEKRYGLDLAAIVAEFAQRWTDRHEQETA